MFTCYMTENFSLKALRIAVLIYGFSVYFVCLDVLSALLLLQPSESGQPLLAALG